MLRVSIHTIVFIVLVLSFNSSTMAGSCVRDFRNISYGGGNMRLRDYYCRGDNGAKVRVQFHRVTDFVATAMLDKTLPTNFQPILGNVKPVPNKVYDEFQVLMDSFGQKNSRYPCEYYQIIASGGVGEVQNKQDCNYDNNKKIVRKSLGGWETGGIGIAIPDDMKQFLRNRKPRSYKNLTSKSASNFGDRSYRRYANPNNS